MQSKVTFNGKTYIETDVNNVKMTDFYCECGNHMHIPLGAVELGLTTSCGHCTATHGYPEKEHCASLTMGWTGLIEDGDICLD